MTVLLAFLFYELPTNTDMERNYEAGIKAARYMGAEYQANPGSSRMEYIDSAAWYFGPDKECQKDLTKEEREALHKAFREGQAAERDLQ